jgi:xylobiose transport system permease protein
VSVLSNARSAAAAPAAERPPKTNRPRWGRRRERPNYLAGAVATLWLVIVGVPIYVMVSDSLQRRDQYFSHGPLTPPSSVTGSNYGSVLTGGFEGYALNTTIITVASVALVLALAIPAAYAIVRSTNRLVSGVFRVFLAGLAIPAQATIIPIYLMITRLHLYDSLGAIILPTVAFGLPLAILVLAANLRDVPRELSEAMTLDGGNAYRLLWNLALPMTRAGIVTVGIYTALNAWNGFLFPLILTQSPSRRVLTLGLFNYQNQFGIDVPGLMAAVLLTALPVFVLYLLARRWVTAGLAGVGGR